MNQLRARVDDGRLILDEPTTLPDGTVLDLVLDDEGDTLSESAACRADAFFRLARCRPGTPRLGDHRWTARAPVSITVVTTQGADAQIRIIDEWWRANRPAAPDLFTEELAYCFVLLEQAPGSAGRTWSIRLGIPFGLLKRAAARSQTTMGLERTERGTSTAPV